MLSLLYIAILAVPLTLLALAFLIIALRGTGQRLDRVAERRAAERRAATPLAPPPSTARRVRDVRLDLRRSLARALDPDAVVPARRVASPRQVVQTAPAPAPTPAAALVREPPLPAGVATKDCPECAETVLAAARICKHCRHCFDGWDELVERASA
jgi:hypothetical protein